MNNQYRNIFSPGTIGKITLKNRIAFAPTDCNLQTVSGEVNQKLIDYYVRRAKGGVGLIVVQTTQTATKIDVNDPYAQSLRIDDNCYIPMLTELTEAVHRGGSKIGILVGAGAGAQSLGSPYDRGLEGLVEPQNVGASERQSPFAQRPVRALSIEEIKTLIKLYGLSARRAMQAGFDLFYIHVINYLIAQFIGPGFNTRDDEYGRDFEGRLRFLIEIIEACRENTFPDFPLVVRMSIEEGFPGGRDTAYSVKVAKRLEEAGVSAIDCMAGGYEAMHWVIPPRFLPKACHADLAAAMKKEVSIPVIAQGRIHDPETAERVLRDGKADFIQMSRALLADPDWVNKTKDSREKEIRLCVPCNHCIGEIFLAHPIRCAINPTCGREWKYGEVPSRTSSPKKVVIVGAGPAGLEVARIAAERGHQVTLFEKTAELGGGQLKLATAAPFKEEYVNITNYYNNQFRSLENLKVVLNKEADIRDIKNEAPDVVILATGSSPSVPKIEGMDNKNIFSVNDVLGGKVEVTGNVVVAGGGHSGLECADWLSEKGIDVTIVEALDECVMDEEFITRFAWLGRLEANNNIKIMVGHTIKRISAKGVIAIDRKNETVTIPADYVVTALGVESYNPLEMQVKEASLNYYVIGDVKKPGKIKDAVADGFFVGYEL